MTSTTNSGWSAFAPIIAIRRTLRSRSRQGRDHRGTTNGVVSPSSSQPQSNGFNNCEHTLDAPAYVHGRSRVGYIPPPPRFAPPAPPPSEASPVSPVMPQRFTRRDQLPTRTQKFRVDGSHQSAVTNSNRPADRSARAQVDLMRHHQRQVHAAQAWPEPAVLADWVERDSRNLARPLPRVPDHKEISTPRASSVTRNGAPMERSPYGREPFSRDWQSNGGGVLMIPVRRSASQTRLEATSEKLATWLRGRSRSTGRDGRDSMRASTNGRRLETSFGQGEQPLPTRGASVRGRLETSFGRDGMESARIGRAPERRGRQQTTFGAERSSSRGASERKISLPATTSTPESRRQEWRNDKGRSEESERSSGFASRGNSARSSLNKLSSELRRSFTDLASSIGGSMPAAAGCTSCRTKYTLLNKEVGCSSCSLSFCKKCVGWQAVVPNLSKQPLSVCHDCYERLEAQRKLRQQLNASVSSQPLPASAGMYPRVPQAPSGPATSFFGPRPTPPQQSTVAEARGRHEYAPVPAPPPSDPSSDAPRGPSQGAGTMPLYPAVGPQANEDNTSGTWWGQGLPPPSMRADYAVPQKHGLAAKLAGVPTSGSPAPTTTAPVDPAMDEIAERARKLKEGMEPEGPPPSIESLEERLAALRGCDIELVRNPRTYFMQSHKAEESEADTVARLVNEATDRAKLEEQYHPDRMLEERARRLMPIGGEEVAEKKEGEGEGTEGDGNRISEVPSISSHMSEVSETTREEQASIDRLMEEAQKRLHEAEREERRERLRNEIDPHAAGQPSKAEKLRQEMGEANKLSRQVSADVARVNGELAGFWKRQNQKSIEKNGGDSSEEEDEVDDAVVERIVKEAEALPDEEEVVVKKTVKGDDAIAPRGSPEKKSGFFGKLFKK